MFNVDLYKFLCDVENMYNDEHAFQRFYMDFMDWNNDGLLST